MNAEQKVFFILLFILSLSSRAQDSSSFHRTLDEVVVTATLSEQHPDQIPVPLISINGKEIRDRGFLRLGDVMQELNGAAVNDYFGKGLQLQGLDPAYTLILLNGQPLIGRNAGTYDLSKIPVNNIERVEVLRGPASSLYGSEALAGVVNIITKKAKDGFHSASDIQYGSFNTENISQRISFSNKNLSSVLFADVLHSSGYDLDKATLYSSQGENKNASIESNTHVNLGKDLMAGLNIRRYAEEVKNKDQYTDGSLLNNYDLFDHTQEISVAPELKQTFGDKTQASITYLYSSYQYRSQIHASSDGALFYSDDFDQVMQRPQFLIDSKLNHKIRITGGTGLSTDQVNTTRYAHFITQSNAYAFAQMSAQVSSKFLVMAGAREDYSNIYKSHVSPKFSAQYVFSHTIRMNASWGKGFKAPDFRQLYLNFSNPAVGYSVYGSEELDAQLEILRSRGAIASEMYDVKKINKIRPEESSSVNAGLKVVAFKSLNLELNFFRNDISGLIENIAVAQKTNGQFVYSYANLNKVFTQGLQIDAKKEMNKNFQVSAGYQYLDAKDKQVLEDLHEGKIYARDPMTGYSVKVKKAAYGGLFNRSAQSGNAKLTYSNLKYHCSISVRYVYKGKYGYSDLNSNGILDSPDEYVPGYGLWNISLNKSFGNNFGARLSIVNAAAYTNAKYIPSLGGRQYNASLHYEF